jgi:F5/8 type C domain-containing protein/glycosyl hydrolase family 16
MTPATLCDRGEEETSSKEGNLVRHTRFSRLPLAVAVVAAGTAALVVPAAAQPADEQIAVGANAVTASTSDENEPANAVDGDLGTRWSGEGDNAWLQLDLGSAATVSQVKLAVYEGDSRQNVFELQYRDGSDWVTVYDGETSGTTTELETFEFEPVETSAIRYLGHGYDGEGEGEGDWNSLTEVQVWGASEGDGGGGGGGGTDGTEAAVRYDWGEPLPISDEFNYTGPVDPEKWGVPDGDEGGTEGCWAGHSDNGRRCAKNSTVADGMLTMLGEENGDTGWLRQNYETQYGRWEIRSRSRNTGTEGELYHPLHLIWPTSDDRLEDGEYDWVEYTDPDAQCLGAWMHYPQSPDDEKEQHEQCGVDMTEWHNFAFEWTPEAVVGYVDGEEWFRMADGANDERGNIQDMPSGHLNIQLDNFEGDSGLNPAVFEVDWVRVYE